MLLKLLIACLGYVLAINVKRLIINYLLIVVIDFIIYRLLLSQSTALVTINIIVNLLSLISIILITQLLIKIINYQ